MDAKVNNWKHIVKIMSLLCALMALLYAMRLNMELDDNKKKIVAALKDGSDDMLTMALLHEQQKATGKPDAFVYQITAAILAKNGNAEAAKACIIKAIEMGG
jgi:membrane-bound lytic murein transglycosylase MltF